MRSRNTSRLFDPAGSRDTTTIRSGGRVQTMVGEDDIQDSVENSDAIRGGVDTQDTHVVVANVQQRRTGQFGLVGESADGDREGAEVHEGKVIENFTCSPILWCYTTKDCARGEHV
jgi:hypothetical protein